MILAARDVGVRRFFFSSSACVYAHDKQTDPNVTGLKEEDAYPATHEDGYGWEKLFGERMCRHFTEDFGLVTRVVRYHNVYGPHGTFDGGREKAPAAICRKIIQAKLSGHHEVEIWDSGDQTRSLVYIDNCPYGTQALMKSDTITSPINLRSEEKVSINQLVDTVEDKRWHQTRPQVQPPSPKGVNGRNNENTLICRMLSWEPKIPLREGLEKTYVWIYDQIASGKAETAVVNVS